MPSDRNDVAVFWDYTSCPVPREVTGYIIVQNIRSLALRFGNIKMFKSYLSIANQVMNDPLSETPLQLRSQMQSSGVSVTDVPGGKDVADKMLIVDMLAYAFDRPPQSTVVVLISADPTLAYPLSMLRLRNHNVVVVKPSGSKPDLLMQASLCFDWNEEIIQDFEAESDSLARDMAKLRVSKAFAKEDVVDDRSPASLAPSNSSLSTTTSRRRDEVILEDYFPSESESWSTGTREEKVKSDGNPYYPPTPDTIKTQKAPTGLSREPTTSVTPSFSKPLFVNSELGASTRPSPAFPSLKKLRKKAPVGFRPLVEVLHTLRQEGYSRPLRSSVGLQLIQMDPKVYERIGYTRFAQYASMAVTLGIAELGGSDGKAWISFHPTFEKV